MTRALTNALRARYGVKALELAEAYDRFCEHQDAPRFHREVREIKTRGMDKDVLGQATAAFEHGKYIHALAESRVNIDRLTLQIIASFLYDVASDLFDSCQEDFNDKDAEPDTPPPLAD